MRYKVVDAFDFAEVLCETDDLNEAYSAALKRIEDTDGECTIAIQDNKTVPMCNSYYLSIDFYGEEEE